MPNNVTFDVSYSSWPLKMALLELERYLSTCWMGRRSSELQWLWWPMWFFFRINSTVLPITRDSTVISCTINNKILRFEVDSGSHVSTLRHSDATEAGAIVTPTQHRVMGYSGNAVQLCGQTTVNVQYNGREFTHTFLVVKSSSVNLLGPDLCYKLQVGITVPDCNIKTVRIKMLHIMLSKAY